MESHDINEKPKLNPELETKANLPRLHELKVKVQTILNSRELPSTRQRIIEGTVCGIIAGIAILLIV